MTIYEFTFKCVESGDTPEDAWESVTHGKWPDMPEHEIIEEDDE